MDSISSLVALVAGIAIGAGLVWLVQKGQISRLADLRGLANEALATNQTSFLQLAGEVFDKHRQAAGSELARRQEALDGLLRPMAETLGEYQKRLQEVEKARAEAYGSLSSELRQVAQAQLEVRAEAGRLANALRSNPKTPGRWGEETLKRVLELAGLSALCDFSSEQSFHTAEGTLRPDVVIRMPGNRCLVVDAKTSTSAYLAAVEAGSDSEREEQLKKHAAQLRQHMRLLSSKAYWDGLAETPDFVVMFIPGENFLTAALERDPTLFEDAVGKHVILVTPAILIGLAKAIALGWRQEKVAENSRRACDLGRELYKRLSTMTKHILDLGAGLNSAVRNYNEFVGSLESSVLPAARKFNELEIEGTATPIKELHPVETALREPRRDRDLVFDPARPVAVVN